MIDRSKRVLVLIWIATTCSVPCQGRDAAATGGGGGGAGGGAATGGARRPRYLDPRFYLANSTARIHGMPAADHAPPPPALQHHHVMSCPRPASLFTSTHAPTMYDTRVSTRTHIRDIGVAT